MKKIFTILVAALFAGSLFAADEVVFKWSPTAEECVGSYLFGTSDFSVATVKIHTNTDQITALKCGATYKYAEKKYISIKPAEGSFKAGDVVSLSVFYSNSAEKNALVVIYAHDGSTLLFTSELGINGRTSAADPVIQTYTLLADADSLLLGRGTGSNLTTTYMKDLYVTRPEQKQIILTTEELINAKVNGEALEEGKLNDLKYGYQATLDNSFITAPEVTFVKRVEITYDDKSTEVDTVDVVVTAIESLEYSGMWQASITLGDMAYSLFAGIEEAYTVTYKLADETVLGTELVAVGESPKEYAQYEVRPLATFNGWFDEDYLEEVDMTLVIVNSDMSFYADFDKAFAQSIDFEQMVLNQGKSYDVKTALAANFYDYKDIDALDSLNNEKGAARNEPYLGLKIKKKGGYIACNVLPGTTIRIKFGYVAETVLAIAGNDTMRLAPTNNKIDDQVFPIMVETLVKLQTTSDKTVVIKQIKVDEPIVTWMYPITYEKAEHGKVEGWTIAFPDEEVTITATPDEGYKIANVKVNDNSINAEEGVYKFVMPAENVTVSATFEESATAVENTEAGAKAVKVVRDGQVRIVRDGKIFNVLGTEIK